MIYNRALCVVSKMLLLVTLVLLVAPGHALYRVGVAPSYNRVDRSSAIPAGNNIRVEVGSMPGQRVWVPLHRECPASVVVDLDPATTSYTYKQGQDILSTGMGQATTTVAQGTPCLSLAGVAATVGSFVFTSVLMDSRADSLTPYEYKARNRAVSSAVCTNASTCVHTATLAPAMTAVGVWFEPSLIGIELSSNLSCSGMLCLNSETCLDLEQGALTVQSSQLAYCRLDPLLPADTVRVGSILDLELGFRWDNTTSTGTLFRSVGFHTADGLVWRRFVLPLVACVSFVVWLAVPNTQSWYRPLTGVAGIVLMLCQFLLSCWVFRLDQFIVRVSMGDVSEGSAVAIVCLSVLAQLLSIAHAWSNYSVTQFDLVFTPLFAYVAPFSAVFSALYSECGVLDIYTISAFLVGIVYMATSVGFLATAESVVDVILAAFNIVFNLPFMFYVLVYPFMANVSFTQTAPGISSVAFIATVAVHTINLVTMLYPYARVIPRARSVPHASRATATRPAAARDQL